MQLASEEANRKALAETSQSVKGHRFSDSFLRAEWTDIVDAWQYHSWEEYRDASRAGRKTRLSEAQLKTLWSIFEKCQQMLSQQKCITPSAMFTQLAAALEKVPNTAFDFVIADECQDIGVCHLRFLAALTRKNRGGLFFTGDLGQRIFQTPYSWKSLGVDIRGLSRTLKVNYRTSHQTRLRRRRSISVVRNAS